MSASVAGYLMAVAGGALIGLAAAILLLAGGRVAGVSGLFAQAVGIGGAGIQRTAAIAFVASIAVGAAAVDFALGGLDIRLPSFLTLAVAGVLVGIGTWLGSGCTSGHGVCGVSRLSPRSLLATATFMAAGIATVAIMKLLFAGGAA